MKLCPRCKLKKPLADFYRSRNGSQGRSSYCKQCQSEYGRKWHRENPEKQREYKRRWEAEHPDEVREGKRRRYQAKLERNRQKARERRERNPEKFKEYQRRRHEKARAKGRVSLYRYGLTPEDHRRLLAVQQDACAICRRPLTPKIKPHIDHDHETGQVRGILCSKCNVCLAWFESFARDAGAYVTSPPATTCITQQALGPFHCGAPTKFRGVPCRRIVMPEGSRCHYHQDD